MPFPGFLFLLLLAVPPRARGSPTWSQAREIQVQENFDPEQIYGKWYDIAIGTTCTWMKQYKDKFNMGTLVLGPGLSSNQISTTSTRLRQGVCTQVIGEYEKTSILGKYTYRSPGWNVTINSYVVHTNYKEYAIILMQKKSSLGLTITAKLYGRSPELREGLIVDFRQFAREMGIPEDAIFIMINKGECVPSEAQVEAQQRARRAVLPEEEGSAAGPLPTFISRKEDFCLLNKEVGPCMGMNIRFFYNSSSMACESFHYGGCLGNGNNFPSEKVSHLMCSDFCLLNKEVGPCMGMNIRFFYNSSSMACESFHYGGCLGNGNNFPSEKACLQTCRTEGKGQPLQTVTWTL
uniref:Protein AMBP n=1 Tax=Pelodiscus sinensis TaxID=13735 RepID=K7FJJ5_PELSI